MNTSLGKRLLSILLAAVMVLGMVPVLGTPKVEAAANYVSTENLIRGLPYPAGRLETSLSSNMDGLWLIMSSVARGGDGSTAGTFGYVLDPDRPESGEASFPDGYNPATHSAGYVGYAVRPASTDDINRAQPLGRDYYTKIAGNMGTCTFQTMDGRYWAFEGISDNTTWTALRLKTWSYNFTITSASNGLYRINNGIHYIYSNSWTFRGNRQSTTEAVKNPQRLFRFYRVSEEMLALRDTLQEALVYVVDNSTGRFNQDKHAAYLDLLCSAANDYTSINSARAGSMVTTADKQKIEEDKKKILNAMAELKLSDTMENQPYDVVLDYGKPIEVDLSGIQSTISKRSGTSLQYVGSLFTGEQGQIQETIPEGLTYNAAGQSYETDMGIFSMTTDRILRYTPKTFMDRAETFYAVHKITTTSDPNYVGYLLTKVQLLPANIMYYEAESFRDLFSFEEKVTSSTGSVSINTTLPPSVGTAENELQTTTPIGQVRRFGDYTQRRDVVFFDFDNSPAAQQRYKLPQYNGVNFDTSVWEYNSKLHTAPAINHTEGTLSISSILDPNSPAIKEHHAIYTDTSKVGTSGNLLNYDMTQAEIFQIRFKMEKNYAYTNEQYLGLHLWGKDASGNWLSDAARSIFNYYYDSNILTNGEYVTISVPLGYQVSNLKTLTGVRPYFGMISNKSNADRGRVTIDYIYIGPRDCAPTEENYGEDASYCNDPGLSNGSSLYFEGKGIQLNETTKAYTKISFSFTGTGVDVISQTGPEQGDIMCNVYSDEAKTMLAYTERVNAKGEQDLYQIPLLNIRNLEYGTYYVDIFVKAPVNLPNYPMLYQGNQFYLDAVRIYDPLGSENPSAYYSDGEAEHTIVNIRDILLSRDTVLGGGQTMFGAVYLDESKNNGNTTDAIATYEKIGPKNELYLGQKQKVAMQLKIRSDRLPETIAVAIKSITGDPVAVCVGLVPGKIQTAINAAAKRTYLYTEASAAQYFELEFHTTDFVYQDGYYSTYMILSTDCNEITNTMASSVVSITDIKIGFGHQTAKRSPGATEVTFPVDADFVEFVNALVELPNDPMPEEGVAFAGASVSLQSDLAIHFKAKETLFTEEGYHSPYVVINDNGTEVILRDYEVKDGKYAFIYRNIAPHRIGDTVTATLYAYYGDTLHCSESKDYSVADYCYNMLGKTAGIDSYAKLRALLVDILLYGAKTQEYMSYRLDSLCTGRLTEEQLAWGTAECRELENHRDQAYETIENPEVQWRGAGLNLRESVAIRFKIEAESYEDLVVKITVAGKTYSIYAKDFDHREDGTYVHFKTINAAQMSEPVYATVYRDGQQVSHTICYSIESYAYSKQNDPIPHLADLVKRMMCYGDSTKAYVG